MSKPKKIVLSPILKRALQKEGRDLARREAAAAETRRQEAREQLQNAEQVVAAAKHRKVSDGFFNAVGEAGRAVMRSWGVAAPLRLEETSSWWADTVKAWTDFHTVHVQYPAVHKMVNEGDTDALRRLVFDLKGLIYHETGHIRFSIPYDRLERQGVYQPNAEPIIVSSMSKMAWNVLEDQRMECAVVAESPVIAKYFTVMVSRHIMGSGSGAAPEASTYLLVAGRTYLPKALRREMRRLFVSAYGEDLAVDAERIIAAYKTAKSGRAMRVAINKFIGILEKVGSVPNKMDEHRSRHEHRYESPADVNQQVEDSAAAGALADEDDTDDTDDTPAEGEGEGEGDTDGGEGDTESSSSGDSDGSDTSDDGTSDGGSDGEGDTDGGTSDAQSSSGQSGDGYSPLGDTLKEIEDSVKEFVDTDTSINGVLRDMYEALNSVGDSILAANVPTGPLPDEWVAKANDLASALTQALNVCVADDAPMWQTHMKRGVIDPFAYRTRQPGSMEFHRLYDGDGSESRDIAVTIALDTSGSMAGAENPLGAVAYACKSACDTLGIPCTVTTFDSDGRMLWGVDDTPTPVALCAQGGTQPHSVLADLDSHRQDKTTHLVLLMTDGEFSAKDAIQRAKSDGRVMVALGLNAYAHTIRSLKAQGFDEAFAITDLSQIAEYLTAYLQFNL